MTPVLATIVEGHGEVQAVPILLRKFYPEWKFPRPIRVKRNRVVKPGEFERYLQVAEATIMENGGTGAILVLLDADDDCPAELGRELLGRLAKCLPNRNAAVVLPKREFEAWILAGTSVGESLSTLPDECRSPKAKVKKAIGGTYSETVDQPKLTAQIDIDLAKQQSRSFRKLCDDLSRIQAIFDQSSAS